MNEIVALIESSNANSALHSTLMGAYHTIFENTEYIKRTVDWANRIYTALISIPPEYWHAKKLMLRRDSQFIAYRFNNIEGIDRLVIAAGRVQRNTQGVYGTMADTKDPAIILPMVDDKLWDEWTKSEFFDAPEDMITRLRALRPTTIHELTHLLDDHKNGGFNDHKMSDTEATRRMKQTKKEMSWAYDGLPDKYITQDIQYMNKPTEFNARFIASVQNAVEMGRTSSFEDFSLCIRNDSQMGSVLPYITPENKKRFLKWLYQAYEIVKAKPMTESAEPNAVDIILSERSTTEHNLVLEHGAPEPYDTLRDNTFMCEEGSYLPENYAENEGGVVIKGTVDSLKILDLCHETNSRIQGHIAGSDPVMKEFLHTILGDRASYMYGKSGLMVFSRFIGDDSDWQKLIDFVKSHGFDAVKFKDESFDTMIWDYTYIIFDGSKITVTGVREP